MKRLLLKIGAFFIGLFAIFRWGKATAQKEEAEKKADESIRKDKEYKKIMSSRPLDKPFTFVRKKE